MYTACWWDPAEVIIIAQSIVMSSQAENTTRINPVIENIWVSWQAWCERSQWNARPPSHLSGLNISTVAIRQHNKFIIQPVCLRDQQREYPSEIKHGHVSCWTRRADTVWKEIKSVAECGQSRCCGGTARAGASEKSGSDHRDKEGGDHQRSAQIFAPTSCVWLDSKMWALGWKPAPRFESQSTFLISCSATSRVQSQN